MDCNRHSGGFIGYLWGGIGTATKTNSKNGWETKRQPAPYESLPASTAFVRYIHKSQATHATGSREGTNNAIDTDEASGAETSGCPPHATPTVAAAPAGGHPGRGRHTSLAALNIATGSREGANNAVDAAPQSRRSAHRKGATGRVRTGDQQLAVLAPSGRSNLEVGAP